MSSNEKETESIQNGEDNSVKKEDLGATAREPETTAGRTASEQSDPNAQIARDAAKPEKAEKKFSFWRFSRNAKAKPAEQSKEKAEPLNDEQGPKPAQAQLEAVQPEQPKAEAPGQYAEEPKPEPAHEQPKVAQPEQQEVEAPGQYMQRSKDEPARENVAQNHAEAAPGNAYEAPKQAPVHENRYEVEDPEIADHAADRAAPPTMKEREQDEESGIRDKRAAQDTEYRSGFCGQIFNGLAHIGPLALICLLACMVWPDYWQAMRGEALYCPPEANSITTFLNSIAQRNMLEPHGLSAPVAEWPGFIWFAGLLALIPLGADLLWPMVASIGAALALVSVWSLAHASRFGSKAAFAAGLILLCAPIFAPLGHFVGKSALTAALVLFALAFFAHGWLKDHAWISLPLAFVFSALAGLTGGIYAVALPLLASFCFLIWRGNPGRASKSDAILGFGLFLAIVGVWLGFIMIKGNDPQYINDLLANSWQNPWPLPANWWVVGLVALLGLVPWIVLVICVSWVRVLKTSIKTLSASRKDNGSALVWISAVLAWLLALVLPGNTHIAVITLVCLLAVLLGKAFVNLPAFGNRLFFLVCALALVITGLAILGCGFKFTQPWILGLLPIVLPAELPQLMISTSWAWIIGAICLVGGLIMFMYFKSYRQGGGLVFCTLLVIVLSQPAVLLVAPGLGAKSFSQLKTLQTIEQNLTQALKAPEKEVVEEPKSPSAPATPEPGAPAEAQPKTEPAAEPAASQNSGTLTAPVTEEKSAPQVDAPAAEAVPEAAAPAAEENADQGAEQAPNENSVAEPTQAAEQPDAPQEQKPENGAN